MQIVISYHPDGDLAKTLEIMDRKGLRWANGKTMQEKTNKVPVWINIYIEYNQGALIRKCKYSSKEDNNDLRSHILPSPEYIPTVLSKVHEIINSSYDYSVVEKKLFDFNRQLPSLFT